VSSVADVGYIAIVVAGFGAYWWHHLRAPRQHDRENLAPDAEVVVHVAMREASLRHQELSSLHVLYGLLQDDAVIAAIRAAGGDPDALEGRVLDALATGPGAPVLAVEPTGDDDRLDHGPWIVRLAVDMARSRARRASCTDLLWAVLTASSAGKLLDASAIDRGGVLFRLVHRSEPPELPIADELDVLVVLRNDDYSTQQFVFQLLYEVFELTAPEAKRIMLEAHDTGRAVVGRLSASAARAKITEARARARPRGFPLWLGVEPA